MKKSVLYLLIACMIISITACSFAQEKPSSISSEEVLFDEGIWKIKIPKIVHSDLYIPGVPVEDVITYFAEVCLDSEYSTSSDVSMVKKWVNPIPMKIYGEYSEEEYKILKQFIDELNEIEGFPGIRESDNEEEIALRYYFCTSDELQERLGASINYENADGAAVYWYNEYKELYEGTICCRKDLDAKTKHSVMLEELYNILGAIQDTTLREDSIIYQYSSDATSLSEMDWLILKLLYHPDIRCDMRKDQCEEIIRTVYY